MSSINFGATVSMLTVATPSTGWLLGYDVDGYLKQKDSEGVITQVGLGGTASIPATPTLSEVLSMSNVTGTYSIVMGTQTIISTSNGYSYLSLDPGGSTASAQLKVSDGVNENGFVLVSGQSRILSTDGLNLSRIYVQNSLITEVITDSTLFFTSLATASYYSVKLEDTSLFTGSVNILESGSTYDTGTAYKIFLHLNSPNAITNNGVANSVIIGGENVTAEESNTVYLPQVVIRNGDKIKGAGGSILKFEESSDAILGIENNFLSINSIIGIFSSTSSSTYLSDKNGLLVRDTYTYSYSPSAPSPVTFISTEFSYVSAGIYNTVIIGGNNLTATASDTVYLGNKVNINNAYTLPDTDGSTSDVLLTDGSGNLYWDSIPPAVVSTFSLHQVLIEGNDTFNMDIMMGTGSSLVSGNLGGRIYLDKSGVTGNVFIGTNDSSTSDTHIDMTQTDLSIYTPGIYSKTFDSSVILSGNLEGLVYGSDYSATFATFSLVDKNYVNQLFNIASPTASNGIEEILPGIIGLGGTLSQVTTIYGDNFSLLNKGFSGYRVSAIDIGITFSNSFLLEITDTGPTPYDNYLEITSSEISLMSGSGNTSSGISSTPFGVSMIFGDTLNNTINTIYVGDPDSVLDGSLDNRMIVSDNLNNKGLVYYDDYVSNFTTYSLVTKGYVDLIPQHVENGLTQSITGNIGLGGMLTQQTIIDGNSQDLNIENLSRMTITASAYLDNKVIYDGYYSQQFADYSSYYAYVGETGGNTYSQIYLNINSAVLESYQLGSVAIGVYNEDQPNIDGSDNNRLIVSDKVHDKGLMYNGDYSANFTTHSLVSKGYVDSKIGNSPGNGLEFISSGVIGLGGTLSQAARIKADGNNFNIDGLSRLRFTASSYIETIVYNPGGETNRIFSGGSSYFNRIYDSSNLNYSTGFFIDNPSYASMTNAYLGSTYSTISVSDEGAFIEVGTGGGTFAGIYTYNYDEVSNDGSTNNSFIVRDDFNNKGLVYLDDYSSNFTTHSLVTKGYVDSIVSSSPGNGLDYVSTGIIGLGGTLSQNTTINSNGFDLSIGDANSIYLTSSNIYLNGEFGSTKTELYITYGGGGMTSYWEGNTYSQVAVGNQVILETFDGLNTNNFIITQNTNVVGDGSTDNLFVIKDETSSKGLVYQDDYTGNFTTHSLVSKGYVDSKKPYKVYTALLSQSGTASPTSVELENTFGVTATFSYISTGYYELYMTGQFTSGKTFIINGCPDQGPIGGNFGIFLTQYSDTNKIRLSTLDDSGTFYEAMLNNTSIEIRVYP